MHKHLVPRVDNQVILVCVLECVRSKLLMIDDLIVGSGVIADCYPVERRGAAFGKYFFGVFIGPLTGPILGMYKLGLREGHY